MASLRDLSGRGWHEWPRVADADDASLSSGSSPSRGSGDATPASSRASTPPSTGAPYPDDDVMKLPRRDMRLFGRVPAQDDLVVGVCEACGLLVKIASLEAHVRLRHGPPPTSGGRGSGGRGPSVRVDLTKIAAKLKQASRSSSMCSSLTSCPPPSRSVTPTPDKEVASPPVGGAERPAPDARLAKYDPEVDADVTSSNVISIPDTDPLPHDMSGDLMAMVSEVTRGLDAGSFRAPGASLLGYPVQQLQLQVQVALPAATRPGPAKSRPKAAREYHPDQHCGVWDGEGRKQCTRALTCKSHSVLLKRKIAGRTRPFDELLASHKKAQAALVAAGAHLRTATPASEVGAASPSAAVARPPAASQRPAASVPTAPPPPSLPPLPPPGLAKETDENFSHTLEHPRPLAVCTFNAARIGGLVFCGRNRTLAAKLVKLSFSSASAAPVASSPFCRAAAPSPATGFRRITPKLALFRGDGASGSPSSASPSPLTLVNGLKRRAGGEQTLLINYNVGGKRTCGSGAGAVSPGVHLGPPQSATPDSFQTDIQDFKGGLKFEYGSTIKLTQLKSGSDLA